MASLLDIAPLVESVDVRGVEVEVHGVSARGIVLLLARFPEIRMLMSGKEVGVERLMEMGGDAVAAVIAAGCGMPGEADAERAAGLMSVDLQADFLAKILKLTLPNGVGPFVEKLTALGTIAGAQGAEKAARSPKGQGTNSPKRSSN